MRILNIFTVAVALAGCQVTERHLHVGTDDGFHQKAGLEATRVAFGLGGKSDTISTDFVGKPSAAPQQDARDTPDTKVRLRRTRAVGLSVASSKQLTPRVRVTGRVYSGAGQIKLSLPEGVLLSNGRTRLSDPMTVEFLSLRVEPQAAVSLALGPARTPWARQEIGAGIAMAHVRTKLSSALIRTGSSEMVADPFLSATTHFSGAAIEIRQYRDFGTTGKVEWLIPF